MYTLLCIYVRSSKSVLDLEKLFAMTLFKCLAQLLSGITAAAREASLHQYEEEEEREDGLEAERAVFGNSDLTSRLFQIVQVGSSLQGRSP